MRAALSAVLGALAAALAASSVSAGFLQEVGEWAASCDNEGTCSLVNSSAGMRVRTLTTAPFGLSRFCLHEGAGAQSTLEGYITLITAETHLGAASGPLSLRLIPDGLHPDAPLDYRGASHWQIPFSRVSSLRAAFLSASQAEVVARDGRVVDRLPLDGLNEAAAAVEAARRNHRPIRPTSLVTAPLTPLDPAPAPSAAAQRLRQETCGAPGNDTSRAYRLLGDGIRADRTLWVTPCITGPSFATTLFVVENADGSAEPMAFPGASPARPTGRPGLLATAQMDASTGRVRELWRVQGVAGAGEICGVQRLWGWNGRDFELAEERRTLSCTGIITGYWPRVFRRPMILPASENTPAVAAGFRLPC